MPRPTLYAAEIENLKRLHAQGTSTRELARLFNLSRNTISNALQGRLKPRDREPSDTLRNVNGIRCRCGANVTELFRVADGTAICLACAIRTGQAHDRLIPRKTDPVLPIFETYRREPTFAEPVAGDEDGDDVWF